MKKYFIGLFIIVVVLYAYFGGQYLEERQKKDLNIFNEANINGEIEFVEYYDHGRKMKIKGMDEVFKFHPLATKKDKVIFGYIAEPGDWISKPPYATTIKLYHKGKLYEFEFH